MSLCCLCGILGQQERFHFLFCFINMIIWIKLAGSICLEGIYRMEINGLKITHWSENAGVPIAK